jgi:MoxR-like ATPase
MDVKQECVRFRERFSALKDEVGKVIVGQEEIVEGVLIAVLGGGHCLLEGVPGLGKTMLVRTLADVLELKFSRIQFTPDLMPADIIGTQVINEVEGTRKLVFQQGPIFANIVLADEINRATPKTQSAMLETMQEKCVTVGGVPHQLDLPFFVLATQNPLEMEGTYPLPEAQLDRFFFKLMVKYPSREELTTIVTRTTERDAPTAGKVMDGEEVRYWQSFVRDVAVAPHVQDYAIRLVLATHPGNEFAPEITTQYIRYGASPRAAQTLILASKIRALIEERYNISFEDVEQAATAAMRHRLILNFEAEAEGIDADHIIEQIMATLPRQVELVHG